MSDNRMNRREFFYTGFIAPVMLALLSCREEKEGTAGIDQSAPSRQTQIRGRNDQSGEELMRLLDLKVKISMHRSHHCAQTSFLVLQEEFDLEDGSIVKALTPLPGIGERGETCGAVIGSLMALGLVFGRESLDDWTGFRTSLVPARTFCDLFEQEYGSTMCGDILKLKFGKRFNLADSTELAEFQAAGASGICPEVVSSAVQIAAEVILEYT